MPITQHHSESGGDLGRASAPRYDDGVFNEPDEVEHADEARMIEGKLRELGLEPVQVRPTRDFTGYVRMDFSSLAKLLRVIDPDWIENPLAPLPSAGDFDDDDDALGAEEEDL